MCSKIGEFERYRAISLASEKAQTTVSEDRYTTPNIDVFRTAIITLIAPTGDNAWASFLVHQVPQPPLQSVSIAEYLRSFPSAFEQPSIPVVR